MNSASSKPLRVEQHNERVDHRRRIGVRARAYLNTFWFNEETPDALRAVELEGWMDTLEACAEDEIRLAWADYQRDGPRSARGLLIKPDPGALWQIIRTTRNFQAMATRQASRDLEKPTTVRREEPPATREQREAIMARVYGKKMNAGD